MKPSDIAIVGGGLVGASLALALREAPVRIVLIEASPPPETRRTWDERCIALNAASQRIFAALGVWDELSGLAEPIVSTHISERGRFGVARFTAPEAGLPALGYNIPVAALAAVLWRRAQTVPHLRLLCPARLEAVEVGAERAVLRIDGSADRVEARLVVAADGADSAVRRFVGLAAERRGYEQSAIVTAVRLSRPHGRCAYERFLPTGPIALLPKPGKAASLVWTVPAAQAASMLEWSDARFLAEAQQAFGERLGRFLELGRRAAWPLARVMSESLTAPRVLFAGNAAQSLHPVAAQGFNLGLRDIAAAAELLVEAVRAGDDPGSDEFLSEYARRRTRDREAVAGFTDRLVRLFSNRVPGLRSLRHLGLLVLDLAPPAKQAVMWQNLGLASAPRAARSGLSNR